VKTPLAPLVEHTLLRPEATPDQVDRLCDEAVLHGFFGICVAPLYVARAARRLDGSAPVVVTVVGFPLGASVPAVTAAEAHRAAADGAAELDLVIPIGLALAGDLDAVRRTVAEVREAIPDRVLKVILETGHFAPAALRALARAVLAAGPDLLKTSTGFGPRGASVEDVALLAACGEGRVGVKASGGIRTLALARALVDAGATRLGTSSGPAIANEERVAAGLEPLTPIPV
jgi:deoxyribose-phosphate aldolase